MLFGDANGQATVGGVKLLKTYLKGVTSMMRFRANIDVVEKFGNQKGAVVGWSVIGKLPKVGPTLETSSVPLATLPMLQNTLTVTEYTNSIPFTFKFEALSELDIKKIFEVSLGQNSGESLDAGAATAYYASNVRAVPAGAGFNSLTDVIITTNSVPAGLNNAQLTKAHVRKIITYMKQNNYPTINGMYICIATPAVLEPLLTELDTTFQYTESGFGRIVQGQIGKLDNCLFVEQTNVIDAAWANGKSGKAFFFGAESAIEAVSVPEEIRETVPTDMGRTKQIGWYYIGGFAPMRKDRVVVWDSLEA